MGSDNPYQTYQNQQVSTASPGELTLMLYEGCLKFIKSAESAIASGDYERRNSDLTNAQNIIHELMVTLDKKTEVSSGMMKMYDYIHRCLIQANIRNDAAALSEARNYVAEFRDIWKEIIRTYRKNRFGEGGHA